MSKSGLKAKRGHCSCEFGLFASSAPFLLSLVPNPGNEPSSSKAFLQQQDAHLVRMDCGSDDSSDLEGQSIELISKLPALWELYGNCEIDLAFLLPFPLCHLDMFSFPVFMHGLYSLQANEKQAPSKARSLDGKPWMM